MRGHMAVAWILRYIVAADCRFADECRFENGCRTRVSEPFKCLPRRARECVQHVSVAAFIFAVIEKRTELCAAQCPTGVGNPDGDIH